MIIEKYYDAFNNKKWEQFFQLLSDDVVHDINQNGQEVGKEAFKKFIERMNRSYDEQVEELVSFEKGDRGAAEFYISGKYLASDSGLPPAKGQTYRLRCGAFFEFKNGKITRVTNYYNLKEWLEQVK